MFTVRNYPSDEQYDLGKYMDFITDCYDAVDCPFLAKVSELQKVSEYDVDSKGHSREIDIISNQVYGTWSLSYLIQYYNSIFDETMPEGTVLNLFAIKDLEELAINVAAGNI